MALAILGKPMRVVLVLLTMMLTACSSAPRVTAPVEHRPAPATAPVPQPAPVLPSTPSRPAQTQPQPPARVPSSGATEALMIASTNAAAAGDTRSAITHLQRAIRLDGRNAELWARLSTAFLRDGQVDNARQYANRALALAGNRGDWKRAAWLAIAELEEFDGNLGEANRIRALFASGHG